MCDSKSMSLEVTLSSDAYRSVKRRVVPCRMEWRNGVWTEAPPLTPFPEALIGQKWRYSTKGRNWEETSPGVARATAGPGRRGPSQQTTGEFSLGRSRFLVDVIVVAASVLWVGDAGVHGGHVLNPSRPAKRLRRCCGTSWSHAGDNNGGNSFQQRHVPAPGPRVFVPLLRPLRPLFTSSIDRQRDARRRHRRAARPRRRLHHR